MGRQEDLDAAYAEAERRRRLVEIGDLTSDPVKFAEVMGFELQPWQVEFLRGLADKYRGGMGGFNRPAPYTVAGPGGERVLVTWGDIKAIMDRKLHVGQISSRQGDGSRPYAVFSKRECAAEIAEMVNRRFNSTMGEK